VKILSTRERKVNTGLEKSFGGEKSDVPGESSSWSEENEQREKYLDEGPDPTFNRTPLEVASTE
jgi:hypothetical protein